MNELPLTMCAVYLTGHGGLDMLEYRTDVPVPTPRSEEVLIAVGAAGVNNTDINTRIGWYSKDITSATDAAGHEGFPELSSGGGWAGALDFPRIQGADVAGRIVAVGSRVSPGRLGERVIVRSMQTATVDDPSTSIVTMGSEFDGGFAQFCAVHADEVFAIESPLTDAELASFPCAYSTAEGMLHKAALAGGEHILITGASGGVGSAAIQLAKRRGAEVVAVASTAKWPDIEKLGVDTLVDRKADLVSELGENAFDVVADVVAGQAWPSLLQVLKNNGRYVTSGAIAGPIVQLDVRTLYLKDLTLLGSTAQPRMVFENLVSYIEAGEISPMVAKTYPLQDIAVAQADFSAKTHAGKLVLLPPRLDDQV